MSELKLAAKVAYLKVLVDEVKELMMEFPDVNTLGIEMIEGVDVQDRSDSTIVKIFVDPDK
ncbi:MAG: hypothetical protein ABIK96_00800 [bacterium]